MPEWFSVIVFPLKVKLCFWSEIKAKVWRLCNSLPVWRFTPLWICWVEPLIQCTSHKIWQTLYIYIIASFFTSRTDAENENQLDNQLFFEDLFNSIKFKKRYYKCLVVCDDLIVLFLTIWEKQLKSWSSPLIFSFNTSSIPLSSAIQTNIQRRSHLKITQFY